MNETGSTPGRRSAWVLGGSVAAAAAATLGLGPSAGGAVLVAGALVYAADAVARAAGARTAADDDERRAAQERWAAGLAEAHERMLGQTVAVLRDGLGELRSELKGAVEEAAQASRLAVGRAVEPLAAEAADQAREGLAQLLARLDHDASVRNEREEAAAARLAEVVRRVVHQGSEVLERLERDGATRREAAAERLEALDARLREAEEARSERLGAWAHALQGELTGAVSQLAERLAEQLDERAAETTRELAAQREQLREAGELVHAGGAELCTTAGAFAAALERQQESAREWLVGLGETEARLDAAGEAAAARALEARLDETQELFARQLEFQRELYAQLAALREPAGSGSDAGVG